jgi:hypothetical protein
MADEANLQMECALNTLSGITEKNGNLRKDLKRGIVNAITTLRNIFVNLKKSAPEHMGKITQLESEVKKLKAELQESRGAKQSARVPPSMDGIGETPATGAKQGQTSSGGAMKFDSEVRRANIEKRYKLPAKSKSNQSPETIKNVLKMNINPTEMKAGIKTLKSLKEGRVLIEVGSIDETNLLSTVISDKCGGLLEVNVPKLRKPRLIIRNIPQDITVEKLEETILAQNPDLSMNPG